MLWRARRSTVVVMLLSTLTSAFVKNRVSFPAFRQPRRLFASMTTTNKQYADVLDFHLYGEDHPIGSTQDETKRLLSARNSAKSNKMLAVLAERQDNGRGTQGRKWEGKTGNVYLTVAVPMEKIPVTITLFPLQVGVLIARILQEYSRNVQVKWPNDVLVDERKIAGVLIENWLSPSDHACWLVIGVGINVAYAPALPDGVRPAICLQDVTDQTPSAAQIGTELVHALLDWIHIGGSRDTIEERVSKDWKRMVTFGQLYKIRETGEEVTTLDIKSDGQLKVRGANGQVRFLMADYLH